MLFVGTPQRADVVAGAFPAAAAVARAGGIDADGADRWRLHGLSQVTRGHLPVDAVEEQELPDNDMVSGRAGNQADPGTFEFVDG